MTSATPTAPGLGQTQDEHLSALGSYQYGWRDSDTAGRAAKRGLNQDVVRNISALKDEPEWMLDLRLKGLSLFARAAGLRAWIVRHGYPAGEFAGDDHPDAFVGSLAEFDPRSLHGGEARRPIH